MAPLSVQGNIATEAKDDSDRFIHDILTGQPIVNKLMTSIAASDANAFNSAISQSGYNITDEGIAKVLASTNSGPAFDPRMVAGLYSFHEPKDIAGVRMRVDGLTGSVFFGATNMNSSADNVGNITFSYKTSILYTYTISFISSYNDDGTPQPFTFIGSRSGTDSQDPTKTLKDTVSGTQVVATPASPPTVDWTQMPGWMQASTILTVFGTGIPLFYSLLKATRNYIEKKLEEQPYLDFIELAKGRGKNMADVAANVAIQQVDNHVVDVAPLVVQPSDVDNAVEMGVATGVQRQPDSQNLDLAAVRSEAEVIWRDRVRERFLELNGAAVNQAMSPFSDLLDANGQQRAVEQVASHATSAASSAISSSQYFGDVMASSVARIQANDARERVVAANTAHDRAQQELQDAQDRKKENDLELQRIKDRQQNQDQSAAEREADEESVVRIHREQEEIEDEMKEAGEKERTEAEKAREEQKRAEQRDQEADAAHEASQEHEGDVTFHGD